MDNDGTSEIPQCCAGAWEHKDKKYCRASERYIKRLDEPPNKVDCPFASDSFGIFRRVVYDANFSASVCLCSCKDLAGMAGKTD